MLHVTTQVGIIGKQEREKKHFPHIENQPSLPVYHPRGRRYISHGSGLESGWRPHNQNIQPEPTECGPDWSSQLKYIPAPQNTNKFPAAEIFPDNWHALRPLPFTYYRSQDEWLSDPDQKMTFGIRTSFDGEHKASGTSSSEITHQMLYGRNRQENTIDKRNVIPERAPGDKTYYVVEYSDEFHKAGTTLPLVNFSIGGNKLKRQDETFVPLIPMPSSPRPTFKHKEHTRHIDEEINSVRCLENWKPATPLNQTISQSEKKEK